ncbi:MAG: glycosyltransferase [Chloroflexi bacterium]|nr:MAG: glycosyltransferase [Chloroflexota bacterium]
MECFMALKDLRGAETFFTRPEFSDAIVCGCDTRWPKITVVTPSYNQGRYLEQTILSVLNQNYPNLEYLIMDGGSTDNSVEIIGKYEKYLAHWQSQPDGGQAAAIADGFDRGSGEIFAYLNSDDLYLPGTLRMVGEWFQQHKNAEFLYGDCLIVDEDDRVIRRLYPIEFDWETFLFDHTIIQQQAAFWRSDLYRRVGGIDRSLRFCMDYDLWLRMAQAGVRFMRISEMLAAFRWHKETKTARLRHLHDAEYHTLFQRAVGRPLSYRDSVNIARLRLRRYWHEPRTLLEAIRSRLYRPRPEAA